MRKIQPWKLKLLLASLLVLAFLSQAACQTDRKKAPKIQPPAPENGSQLRKILQNLKPQETSELLLLGLHYNGDDSLTRVREFKNGYRTLLLNYHHGEVNLAGDLPYLATPQPNGFYFIGEKKEAWGEYDSGREDEGAGAIGLRSYTNFDDTNPIITTSATTLLQLLKKPSKNTFDPIPDCPDCDEEEEEVRDYFESSATALTYLIPGFATVNSWGENFTGGAHGNRYDHNYTTNFPRLLNENFPVKELPISISETKMDSINRILYFRGISGLFIDGGYEENRKEPFRLSDYKNLKIGEGSGYYQVKVEEKDYVLFHDKGVVQLNIRAHADADYASSGDYNLTTEYEAGPLQIPGFKNSLSFKFSDLAKADTTITDCFLSPKQNILVLTRKTYKAGKPEMDKSELAVVDVQSGKILYRQTLPLNVIMAEWATGKSVDRWLQELKK